MTLSTRSSWSLVQPEGGLERCAEAARHVAPDPDVAWRAEACGRAEEVQTVGDLERSVVGVQPLDGRKAVGEVAAAGAAGAQVGDGAMRDGEAALGERLHHRRDMRAAGADVETERVERSGLVVGGVHLLKEER
jgi:hypothetical protein